MLVFSHQKFETYRAQTFRTAPGMQLSSAEDAVSFVNQRGFVFFWPIKGTDFPSLWTAVAGNRPVPDEHDDPAHVTWSWKDNMLDQRVWYYGRVLRHRNAMISLEILPNFYAISPNYGDPENDYLEQYEQGALTAESKSIYEALLHEGPMDTISLRKAARLSSRESDGRFNKALDDLQMEFKLLPIGIAPVGAWRYAFIYELSHRHFPDLIQKSSQIFESNARQVLADVFFKSVGAAPPSSLAHLMRWDQNLTLKTLKPLFSTGLLVTAGFPGKAEPWVGLPELIDPSSTEKE